MPDRTPDAPTPPLTRGLGPALSLSILGFPVRVRAEFFLIVALLGAGSRSAAGVVEWVGVAFASVLFHEFGHALVGRAFGCNSTIELYGMGGVTFLTPRDRSAPPVSWFGDFVISLAGPMFGLLMGGLVWFVARSLPTQMESEAAQDLVRDLLWVNVGWSVMNLVPIQPYDGGLATRALLVRLFPVRGVRISHWITVVLGTAAIGGALYLRSLWLGYLAARGVIASWSALRFERALDRAWELWDARDFPAARAGAERALSLSNPAVPGIPALELVVLSSLALRDAGAAKAAFDACPPGALSPILRAVIALDSEDHAEAVALLRTVPEPVVSRVIVPLVGAWGSSPWEDRATQWLDAATVAALSPSTSRALSAQLLAAGSERLSRHVIAVQSAVAHAKHSAG